MKTSLQFLLLLGVVAVAMPATTTVVYGGSNPINKDDDPRERVVYGGWNPIYNIDEAEIQGLGEWAVLQHVKRANTGLKFVKVLSGEEQQVSGMNYSLFIQAINDNGENVTYKARMYDPWRPNALELVSFRPAN